jgi:hypothetical protein
MLIQLRNCTQQREASTVPAVHYNAGNFVNRQRTALTTVPQQLYH